MGSIFTLCCDTGVQGDPKDSGIMEESDWQRLGGGELEQPLRDGVVKCVDSRFLISLSESGGRIERVQDLPETAFIGLEDLQKLGTYSDVFLEGGENIQYEWLPVIILSYSWLGRAHPDPYGETLRVLVKALTKLKAHGVIIDFASLPQVPRSEEEEKRFKAGLSEFNVFYSHPHTLVFQVKDFPSGYPFARSYDLPEGHTPAEYQQRGWCFAEACISSLGKTPKFLCNLSRLPEESAEVVGKCMNDTLPPLSPDTFNDQLATKAFTQRTTDLARVQRLYKDAFQSRIRDAKNLMFADLRWGPAEIQDFAHVVEVSQQMHHLDLSRNRVGEEGMMVLSRVMELHPTLRRLRLSNCRLGDAGAGVLGKALKVNTTLTMLDLTGNSIQARGAQSLAEALRLNRALTTLELRGDNDVGAEGARSLAEALKVNSTLVELSLAGTGGEGARFLAEALKVNRALTTLYLGANNIDAEGVKSLAEALKVNGTITTLTLWMNSIGDEGAQSMAEALKVNRALTTLYLNANGIGDDAMPALTQALKANRALVTLHLGGNEIGDQGARALAEALKANTTLTSLHLTGTYIGIQGVRSLEEAANPCCEVHC